MRSGPLPSGRNDGRAIHINHPKVMDVAVIGVPNADFGEEVKAVVQPVSWDDAGAELAVELIAYCRAHLAAYKCPRSVDFDRALPRLDSGKLYKRLLRDRRRRRIAGTFPDTDAPA